MAEPDTAELLKQILLELKTLNRNLELDQRAGVAQNEASLDGEAVAPRLEEIVPSGGERQQEEIIPEISQRTRDDPDNTIIGIGQDGLDNPMPSTSGTDHRGLNTDPAEANIGPLWKLPYYDTEEGDAHPGPSEELNSRWSETLGPDWALPPDGRLNLTLNYSFLRSIPVQVAEKTLREIRDHIVELAAGPAFSRFTITDYLGGGWRYRYFRRYFKDTMLQVGRGMLLNPAADEHFKAYWSESNSDLPCKEATATATPWRRVIEIRGLGVNPPNPSFPMVLPWLPSVSVVLSGPTSDIHTAMRAHVKCEQMFPERFFIQRTVFHVTFYEIIGPTSNSPEKTATEWRIGLLHSDFGAGDSTAEKFYDKNPVYDGRKRPRYLRESALTIMGLHGRVTPAHAWTIVALTPETWWGPPRADLYSEKADSTEAELSLLEVMLQLVVDVIDELCDRKYKRLLGHFKSIVSGKSALLDPDYHDSLLSDNENFSRSKTYFWAINALREMEESITDNIKQLHNCAEMWPHRAISEAHLDAQADRIRSKLSHSVDKLEMMKESFRLVREEAKALRDGLFTASGVMESRASTRLGENVKLLTFVSIFFLPLSFCMSLWSINDEIMSLSALAITTTIVALATYLIVFNINNISGGIAAIYNMYAKGVVTRMKTDVDNSWVDRADAFDKSGKIGKPFKRDEFIIPSKWRILQYAVIMPITAHLAWLKVRLRYNQDPTLRSRLVKVLCFWRKHETRTEV